MTWTSPHDGYINVSGRAWDAWDEGWRNSNWTLAIAGQLVAKHLSIFGIHRTDAAAQFGNNILPGKGLTSVSVRAGDRIEFLTQAISVGHGVGVDMKVEFARVQLTINALHGTVTGAGGYAPGSTATLTASPSPGYVFSGWSGDASGAANPLSLLMNSAKTITAVFTADFDGDGLSDADELGTYGTNPESADSEADGLSDGAEVFTHHTNPVVGDTDGDGFLDGYEVLTGKSPLIPFLN